MARVLENYHLAEIEGMKSKEALDVMRTRQRRYDPIVGPNDTGVYDVEVPITATWRGVVIARSSAEAISKAEAWINDETNYFRTDEICCGRVVEFEFR